MKNIDGKRKLSSRKFWTAASAFICALCILFGVDQMTVEKLAATVSALGVMAIYILAEGYVDSINTGSGNGNDEDQ